MWTTPSAGARRMSRGAVPRPISANMPGRSWSLGACSVNRTRGERPRVRPLVVQILRGVGARRDELAGALDDLGLALDLLLVELLDADQLGLGEGDVGDGLVPVAVRRQQLGGVELPVVLAGAVA